jgi:hypothetical protein
MPIVSMLVTLLVQKIFRHWDEAGEVPGDCAKCHSATGLPTFLKEAAAKRDGVSGVNIAVPTANGLNCATCHNDVATFTRYTVDNVKFPSGAIVSLGEGVDSNLCINCHQGRESTTSLNAAFRVAGVGDDEVSESLNFRNPHYFAAGATLFGTDAKGAYEYTDKSYNGRAPHPNAASPFVCTQCHDTHALTVRTEACSACHGAIESEEDLFNIRMGGDDYDGDGDLAEGVYSEIATLQEQLLLAMQAYATQTAGVGIIYDPLSYPYYFNDTNGDGVADPDEVNGDNSFATWTPRLLRAAYNYQWVTKDPGAFAHNSKYIIQVLYDSLEDLGGDVTGKVRPEVPAPAP